ncbi:hypothetical protein RM545_12900 [Zunongwangia sp. F260]|uniref:Acylneuraminate cytidylyltransferase family protein n=1 Tax=Autumnicola lenta TaxID=3075593 RepID=A0ABU3CMP3_9FLAO|nr:hypothetical protein [Zunongwangia sp. F260]MDT0647591.1 hypothetical protein [Zunongwangia sp. F260]
MGVSVFLPVRRGSERVAHKNTRKFANFKGGLLEFKLLQLKKLEAVEEIVLSTNDEICQKIGLSYQKEIRNLKVIERPEKLGNSTTNLKDLIKHAGEVSNSEDILWTHVTSPFCDTLIYQNAVKLFYKNRKLGYDSLISGREYQDFLLDSRTGEIVNNSTILDWPRTQDLNNWFEINNGIFLTGKDNFKNGKRVGSKPFLFEMGKIASLDIDHDEDFVLAELVYEGIYR